jgi:arylsulfatase
VYCYNLLGMMSTKIASDVPLSPGRHRLVMTFDYDGGGPGLGATVRLLLDGDEVAQGRLERSIPLVFSLDETLDVGRDGGSPVSDDYASEDSEFTGTIHQVMLEIAEGASSFSHLIDPLQRLAVALARQ